MGKWPAWHRVKGVWSWYEKSWMGHCECCHGCCSVAKPRMTLYDPTDCSTPGSLSHAVRGRPRWVTVKSSDKPRSTGGSTASGKELPAMLETWVQSLGWEDPLEESTATHFSILAWRILCTEEPGGLRSPWGRKASDTTEAT